MIKEIEEEVYRFAKETLGVGVTLTKGKIEYENVEAIACAVDNSLNLAASGSVAESLLSCGGQHLQNACRRRFPVGIKYGDVIVLKGWNLKCKKVFLTSLADIEDEDKEYNLAEVEDKGYNFETELKKAFSAILDRAIRNKVKSIAIPAIGIGKIGLSAKTVARIYFLCVKEKKSTFRSLRNITFSLYDNSVFKEFERQLFLTRDSKGKTILHAACLDGKINIWEYILDNYPRFVNIRDNDGMHILHYAAASGSVACLQLITGIVIPVRDQQHRAQYMSKCLTYDGRTILHVACRDGNTKMCQYIVDNYPGLVNIKDNDGWHILHYTAASGSVDCLQEITDIVIPDRDKQYREQYMLKCLTKDGKTILHVACHDGNAEMCQYIADHYPELLNTKYDGMHILHYTAAFGSVACLQEIADIIIPDRDQKHREQYMKYLTYVGRTILQVACHNGNTEMCQYIMNHYPKLIKIRDDDGMSILHYTALSGSVACLQLIAGNVFPQKRIEQCMLECLTDDGRTILHVAYHDGKTEMCQYIMNHYPKLIKIRDCDGMSILHYTALSGSVAGLQLIADNVIPQKRREQFMLECLTSDGRTILHVAGQARKTDMCQYIVKHYPRLVKIKNKYGWHILHYMAASGSVDCLQRITDIILPDKGTYREQYMLKCLTNDGRTILHVACLYGGTEMCQYITDIYPRLVDITTNDGLHILHYAAALGSVGYLQHITDIILEDKDIYRREQYMLQCVTRRGFTIHDVADDYEMRKYIADTYPKLTQRKSVRDGDCLVAIVSGTSFAVFYMKTSFYTIPEEQNIPSRKYYKRIL